jgi:hypothetical protein
MEERRRRTKREARGEMLDGRSQKPEGKSPDRVAKGIERSSAWMKGQELGRCTMGRRKMPSPEHRSPHEQRLRAIVDSLVTDSSQKAAYLAFAQELALTERHARQPRPQAASADWETIRNPRTMRRDETTRLIRTLIMRVWMSGLLPRLQPVVWPSAAATILPGSGRPTGRPLGSLCRRSARYGEARNGGFFETNTEPNGDANDCWNSVSNDCWNNQPDSDRFRSRYRSLFSRRHACRRKRLHG